MRRRRQRGQAIAEFAIIFPLVALAVAAVIDFGVIIWTRSMVAGAAHVGARYAIVNASKGDCPLDATGSPTTGSPAGCERLSDVVAGYVTGVPEGVAVELCYEALSATGCTPLTVRPNPGNCPSTVLPRAATTADPAPKQGLRTTVVVTAPVRPFFLGLLSGIGMTDCLQITESSTMVVQH